MRWNSRRLAVAVLAIVIALVTGGLAACGTANSGTAISESGPTTCASNNPSTQSDAGTGAVISDDNGTPSANNNVQFYFGPPSVSGGVWTVQVQIHTAGSKGFHATTSHAYGWATVVNNEVYVSIPKDEQVLDLEADYGTSSTPTFDNISLSVFTPVAPIPLQTALTVAANCTTSVTGLTDVTAEFYDPSLPLVPCVGENKC